MKKKGAALSKRRPSAATVSTALVNAVIHRIAAGETLTAICREDGMPDYRRLWERIHQSSSLRAAWERAREVRANRWAEEMTEIAEDGTNDYMEKKGRNGTFIALNEEHVRRSQLRIDTRKWLLAKSLPARYGERVEHTGAGGGPVQVEHSISARMIENLAALRARLPALPMPVSAGVIDVEPVRTRTAQHKGQDGGA